MNKEKSIPTYEYKIPKDGVTLLAGTVLMGGTNHVRQAEIRLPRFKKEPVVTATVHSKDSVGTMFKIWNITYNDLGNETQIAFFAQNIEIGKTSDYHFLCSFTVVGELMN